MPRPPRPILVLAAALNAGIALSGLFGMSLGLRGNPANWFVVGLEAVIVFAGVMGILAATRPVRGFREGPAIGMLCVAGSAIACAGLSYIALKAGFNGIQKDPLALGRFAAAGGLVALAALAVLLRKPRDTVRPLLLSAVMLAASLGIAATFGAPGPRHMIHGTHAIVEALIFLVGGVVFVGFFSAGIHLMITAFDRGRLAGEAMSGAEA